MSDLFGNTLLVFPRGGSLLCCKAVRTILLTKDYAFVSYERRCLGKVMFIFLSSGLKRLFEHSVSV